MRIAVLLVLAALTGCARNPAVPNDPASFVSLTVASVDVRDHSAHIVWSVRPGVAGSFLIQRRLGDAPWKRLAYVGVDHDARLVLDDASVQPGARYAYRVRVVAEPEPVYAGEVAIEVPAE